MPQNIPFTLMKQQHSSSQTHHIGIFGGSFNPIHLGHIALARQLLNQTYLEEIWFVVSPLNPFKKEACDLLDNEKRLELTRLSLKNEPGLVVSDFEFHLPKPSYTYRTLCELSATYPDKDFTLIMGADNWLSFSHWDHQEDILRRYPIMVYPRPHHIVDPATLPPHVTLTNTPLYPFNSTDIRHCIRQGMPIRSMVKPEIEAKVVDYYRQLFQQQGQ